MTSPADPPASQPDELSDDVVEQATRLPMHPRTTAALAREVKRSRATIAALRRRWSTFEHNLGRAERERDEARESEQHARDAVRGLVGGLLADGSFRIERVEDEWMLLDGPFFGPLVSVRPDIDALLDGAALSSPVAKDAAEPDWTECEHTENGGHGEPGCPHAAPAGPVDGEGGGE